MKIKDYQKGAANDSLMAVLIVLMIFGGLLYYFIYVAK